MQKEDLISREMLGKFTQDFKANPQYKITMNAIIKNGIDSSAINQESLVKMQFIFSDEMKIDKITNQKQSGRCWLFAGLNVLRQKVIEKNNLKGFELSQNYQMFWDKLEKANYFLENIFLHGHI